MEKYAVDIILCHFLFLISEYKIQIMYCTNNTVNCNTNYKYFIYLIISLKYQQNVISFHQFIKNYNICSLLFSDRSGKTFYKQDQIYLLLRCQAHHNTSKSQWNSFSLNERNANACPLRTSFQSELCLFIGYMAFLIQ